jgi:hypothetical protein
MPSRLAGPATAQAQAAMRALLTRVAIDKQQSTINLGVGTRRALTFTNARTHARTHHAAFIPPTIS